MIAFWQSLLFIAIAEMGDKTQLVSLAFATRFRIPVVIGGIFVATLLVHVVSVGIGGVLGLTLPGTWIAVAAGIAFIGFGVWTLRGDKADEAEKSKTSRYGAFATVAMTFFLAELGDKTMLTTVTLASRYQTFVDFVLVWLGSTLGMVLADGLAIIVGIALGKRLPEKAIRYGAAGIFIGTGIATLISTVV